jgi:hypothetical protein
VLRAKVYNRPVAAPDPRSFFPTNHLRAEDGSAAPPASGETLYALFHTGCPTSELAWPYLERLRRIGEGRGLRIVAVSQDSPEETRQFQSRLGVAAETLYDPPPWRASEALGLESVPAFVRVGPEGRLEELVVGFQKERMAGFAARSAALAGLPPSEFFRPDENVPAIRPG